MKNVLITGGTGLVGSAITPMLLERGYKVSYLSRSKRSIPDVDVYRWDVRKGEIEKGALENADAVIHLAGAGVADEKWTTERKKVILESRTKSTALLNEKMKSLNSKPEVFISASAIGIYGMNTGKRPLKEDSKPGNDFLAKVTREWEDEIRNIETPEIRTAWIRVGVVLSEQGGALEKMSMPVKLWAGAPLGSGDQVISWIHIKDLCRIFIEALENPNFKGAYNGVAPHPVSNRALTKGIAQTLGKPLFLPNVPEFAMNLMLGEMAQIVLGGNYVKADKLLNTGFQFQYEKLGPALKDLLK